MFTISSSKAVQLPMQPKIQCPRCVTFLGTWQLSYESVLSVIGQTFCDAYRWGSLKDSVYVNSLHSQGANWKTSARAQGQ